MRRILFVVVGYMAAILGAAVTVDTVYADGCCGCCCCGGGGCGTCPMQKASCDTKACFSGCGSGVLTCSSP